MIVDKALNNYFVERMGIVDAEMDEELQKTLIKGNFQLPQVKEIVEHAVGVLGEPVTFSIMPDLGEIPEKRNAHLLIKLRYDVERDAIWDMSMKLVRAEDDKFIDSNMSIHVLRVYHE